MKKGPTAERCQLEFPGDVPEDVIEREYDNLRERAASLFGRERADMLEESLRGAAGSVARLEGLHFSRDDAPGFYLHETPRRPGE